MNSIHLDAVAENEHLKNMNKMWREENTRLRKKVEKMTEHILTLYDVAREIKADL